MTVLVEADLEIELPAGAVGRRLDDPATHGLSHCMKAVDFVVELKDKTYYIELKDPDNPKARPEARASFVQKLASGTLDAELQRKYRDTFLYEWASERADKPIYYLVLLGMSSLSRVDLLARTDALRKHLPIAGPGGRTWPRAFVAGCAVMNIEAWNQQLGAMRVRRLSAA